VCYICSIKQWFQILGLLIFNNHVTKNHTTHREIINCIHLSQLMDNSKSRLQCPKTSLYILSYIFLYLCEFCWALPPQGQGLSHWKFYLIKTSFTLSEQVFLVKAFRLFRLERIFFGVQSVDTVGRCTPSYLLAGPACLWCLVSWVSCMVCTKQDERGEIPSSKR
jgi:hypothetical protein